MTVGLIARADDRGLGTLTLEFHRHVRPERTLVLLTGDNSFVDHPERFTFGEVTTLQIGPNLTLDETVVRGFLDGLDVVYSAETFYDWRAIEWAAELGVKTVCHGMPELCAHARRSGLPQPDEWWWPTTWLTDARNLPTGKIVPIPTIGRDAEAADPHQPGPLRVSHPGGKQALGDRDGTELLIRAMRYVRQDVELTIYTQDRSFNLKDDRIDTKPGPADRWDLYRGHHVTVLPRRYGGLSLKVHESLDVGVPVIMSRIEPNGMWPGPRVPAVAARRVNTPFGAITTYDADPVGLAREIDLLAADRHILEVEQRQAHRWAKDNMWSYQIGLYRRSLDTL